MQQAWEVDHGWAFELDERACKAERSWGNGCGCTWGRRLVCGTKQDGRGKERKNRKGRKWKSCSVSSCGGELDLFVSAGFLLLSASRCAPLRWQEELCGVEDFTEASSSHKIPTVCRHKNPVTFNIVMCRDAWKTPAPLRSSSGYND